MVNLNNCLKENVFRAQIDEIWEEAERDRLLPNSNRNQRGCFNACEKGKDVKLSEKGAEAAIYEALFSVNSYRPNKKSNIESKDGIIKNCHRIYENAFTGRLPCMLFGEKKLRNLTRSSDSPNLELQNFGAVADSIPSSAKNQNLNAKKGAILCDGKWSPIKNDAFMLGSIHAKKTFYLFNQTKIDPGYFWDFRKNKNCLNNLGRELVMLHAAGYKQVASKEQMESYGPTFVCLDHAKAQSFTLTQAYDAIKNIKNFRDFQIKIIKSHDDIVETDLKEEAP